MRIYYVSASVVPGLAANSVQVMKMCEAFARLGHEVTLFAEKGMECDPYTYYSVDPIFELVAISMPPRVTTARRELVRCFQREIQARGVPDLYYGRNALALLAIGNNAPVVYETHLLPTGLLARTESRLFKRHHFRNLVAVSDRLARAYNGSGPEVLSTKIIVAGSAASSSQASQTSSVPHIRVDTKRINVGYVGSLSKGRGIPTIAALAKRLHYLDFHIVGGTPEQVSHWKGLLSPPQNLRFHGAMPHGAAISVMNRFDILVAPYERRVFTTTGLETGAWASPMKIFEYMSCGKAVVASDLPMVREVMVHGMNGLLARAGVVSSWEAAISRLCANDSLRRYLGGGARRTQREMFTWSGRAELILERVGASASGSDTAKEFHVL